MTPLDRLVRVLVRRATRPEGGVDRRVIVWSTVAGYVLFVATYVPINHWSIGRPARVLYLPGEARLPFLPEFEYLYALAYVLPAAFAILLTEARRFARSVLAFLLTLGVAYATYALLPVYLERPHFTVDSLAKVLLATEYLDPPYNNFPSLHVAISWLVYLTCRDDLRRGRSGFLLVVVGISLSTLFVKQHYAVDAVYGTALALGAWRLAGWWVTRALVRGTR